MSLAAWLTPFWTTDQNGSEACPWLTTTKRRSLRSLLGWLNAGVPEPMLAASAMASNVTSLTKRFIVASVSSSYACEWGSPLTHHGGGSSPADPDISGHRII